MKVIIVGAGELGRLLAAQLVGGNHDVVVIDNSAEELDRLADKLDVMTVAGSCASVATLKKAGADTANALLAVSGDEAANILSCQIASKLGIQNTICRLYSSDAFSEADGIGPGQLGIWRTFSPPEESAAKIASILSNSLLMERIRFSRKDALMAVVEISRGSILAGVAIKNIPGSEMLRTIRFAAILRGEQVIVPHGDTILAPDDKVYVAGHSDNVEAFIDWLTPDSEPEARRLVITGSDDTGRILAKTAAGMGFDVRFVEPDLKKGERLLDDLQSGVMMIHGDPTDEDVLDEAGISVADAFVSVDPDDEDNILSCMLAKRMGARKVISLTHKPEYIRIVPAIPQIDCGFSATLVSVNTVLRLLEGGMMRVDAILQRFRARLCEFRVSRRSPICGKSLSECKLPPSAVLALIFRGSDVITPSGDTRLEPDDIAVAIVTIESAREIEPFFPKQ